MSRSIPCLLLLLGIGGFAHAQTPPSSEFILGDTSGRLTINDFFVASDGTIYSTGQFVNDSLGLYVSGVSENGDRRFELFRRYEFEENGLFIRPYGSSHLLVCGYSEDVTGTFNIRLLEMTLGGEVVWDTTYGARGGTSEVPNDIKVDSHGNIVVGGISQFSEIRYLLLKFSPAGSLLWSIESQPFDGGCFEVHEVLLDANDNIYGITNNTFVADTSHGTIFKWDPEGNVQWQKNINLLCGADRGRNLALMGDTLYVVGTPWIDGVNPTSLVAVALRTNSDFVSYREIPLAAVQQGVMDVRPAFGGMLAVVDGTFGLSEYWLHTFVLSPRLEIVYRDSLVSSTPINGRIVDTRRESFDAVCYGGRLTKVRYSINSETVHRSDSAEFVPPASVVELMDDRPPMLYAMNRIWNLTWERVGVSIYPEPISDVQPKSNQPAEGFELLPAYPNPFNPTTGIRYQVSAVSNVRLSVYDVLGREVAVLVNEKKAPGIYEVTFSASGFASGVYFYRLQAGSFIVTRKMLLLQ